jgi:L-iditol 2-dehydrogenase
MEQAALAEAVSVAIHAARRSQPQPPERCLVLGAGMIGLLVIQSLRALGIQNIAAVDREADRLALAGQFGANLTLLADDPDLEQRVLAWSDQRGPQHVYEVVGAQATIERAIQIVQKGGHVVLVGNLSPRVEVPLQRLVAGEITLHGSCASAGEYPEALQWMSDGRLDVQPIISARCTLDEAAGWIDRLYHGVPNTMKVVVCPNR